jgi:hypothetical protein
MNSLRQSLRTVRRVEHVARRNVNTVFEEQAAEGKHASGKLEMHIPTKDSCLTTMSGGTPETLGFYRNISLLVAIPSCAVITYKVQPCSIMLNNRTLTTMTQAFFMQEHPHPPAFKEWSHLRKRSKKFPWGDGNHSLFHNPEFNVRTAWHVQCVVIRAALCRVGSQAMTVWLCIGTT